MAYWCRYSCLIFLITSPLAQWSKPCASEMRTFKSEVDATIFPSCVRQTFCVSFWIPFGATLSVHKGLLVVEFELCHPIEVEVI